MRTMFRVWSLSFLILVFASAPAWAVGISSATIDYTSNPQTITINGIGFGTAPKVWLNSPAPNPKTDASQMLTPSSVSTTSITAPLPDDLTAGTYELIVKSGLSVAKFEMTYGAANIADVGTLTARFTNLSSSKTAAIIGETGRAEGVEAILATTTALTNDVNTLNASIGSKANANALDTTNANLAANTAAIGALQTGMDTANTNIGALQTAKNPAAMQAALMQWYPQTFSAGSAPYGIAFDGANIWVTSYSSSSDTVTKLNASDGAVLGFYTVGTQPDSIAFDGANVWVANWNSNNVTELKASGGSLVGTYNVGSNPFGIAFDGANIWVTNASSNNVTVLNASTGAPASFSPVTVGTYPTGIAFDGTNIWVANNVSNSVTKLKASDGSTEGIYTGGGRVFSPTGVAFDGANIWVTNESITTVTVLNASDGSYVSNYTVGIHPFNIAFDGANVWVANYGDNTVTKLRASDGTNLDTYSVGSTPYGVAFDGANVWVTNSGSNTVTRIPAQ